MLFPNAGLSKRKQNISEVILQTGSSLCPTLHYLYMDIDYIKGGKKEEKKQSRGFHQVNSKNSRQFDIV
jgi:hypothetical protein